MTDYNAWKSVLFDARRARRALRALLAGCDCNEPLRAIDAICTTAAEQVCLLVEQEAAMDYQMDQEPTNWTAEEILKREG